MTDIQLPKINIICVTWNAEKDLDRCLQSISEQTYPNIGVIIQDGGSTDRTIDIIKKWQDIIEYWESTPDQGIYDAMNKALTHLTGEYVFFIGSDDYLYPEFSAMLFEDLKRPDTIYYANIIADGKKRNGKYSAYKLCHTTINHQSMIYPSVVFEKYQYDVKYKICADHLLNIQLFQDKDYQFEYVDKIIAFYCREGISSLQEDKLFKQDHKKIVKQHFSSWVYFRFLIRMYKKRRRAKKGQ